MNRCNAMPEAISSGLVLQQRLSGATSSLSLGSKSGGWLLWHLMLCLHFGGTPHHFRLSILRRARDVLIFHHFSACSFGAYLQGLVAQLLPPKRRYGGQGTLYLLSTVRYFDLDRTFIVAAVSSELVHRQELCSIIRSCSFGLARESCKVPELSQFGFTIVCQLLGL